LSRLFQNKGIIVTQGYHSRHEAVDIVADGYTFDYVVAHSAGVVTQVINNCNINTSGDPKFGSNSLMKNSSNPGNIVVIKHDNGYFTRYYHLKYKSVTVKVGQRVEQGDVIGYMGNTGYSFGGHVHFEVRDTADKKINPVPYLDKDLPSTKPASKLKYVEGDVVNINGVYQSSTSEKRLRPLIKQGKITRIIENARNPYLLDGGNIGWVNDECITGKLAQGTEYVIKAGDTLSGIAAKFGTTWQRIYEKNAAVIGPNPNLIYPGTKIII
jgi:murein DD-endopeptidase MepM/ murein hydrolase activator NlpD